MLPKNAIVTSYLALEYNILLHGSIIVRVEHHKANKIFRFLFKSERKFCLYFSFAPPQFLLVDGWPKRDDAFEIWQHAAGATVTVVSSLAGNRAISFELTKENEASGHQSLRVIFELFGAQANAFLLDTNNIIIHALRVVKDDRRLKPGALYASAPSLSSTNESETAEIASVAGIKYLLECDGKHHRVLTEPPHRLSLDHRTPLVSLFFHLHQAQLAQQELKQAKATALGVIKREIRKTEGTIARLKQDLAECDAADELRQWAGLLMANLDGKPRADRLQVIDLYHHDQPVDIPLVKGKSILESASTYYKRAKRLERLPAIIEPRLKTLQTSLKKSMQQAEQIEQVTDLAQLQKLISSSRKSAKSTKGVAGRATEESSPHYRTFYSSAGERLLVGKSAAGNDVVTFKAARTYDWWFHAQQATGSHVILVVADKNRSPSKRSILEAAQLAAYYSDLRKSHHVPVMYTERRNVRKAKGNIPGKAIFQQIKSIFVDPGLPPTARED